MEKIFDSSSVVPSEALLADFKEQHEVYETNEIIDAALTELKVRDTTDLKLFLIGLGAHLEKTVGQESRPASASDNEEWACLRMVSRLHEWYTDPIKKDLIVGGVNYNTGRWWKVYEYIQDDRKIAKMAGSLAVS
jgi:hypothetical protein